MSRVVEISIPDHRVDRLESEIRSLEEVVELRTERRMAPDGPRSVVTVVLTSRSTRELLRILDREGVTNEEDASVVISEPSGVISARWDEAIENDESDVVWEEMEFTILRESNMGANGLLVMFISGATAAIGIATGSIHLVIGAAIIAPGFEPINRIALGLVAGGRYGWHRGVLDTVRGYAALLVGAAVAAGLLVATGRDPLRSEGEYVAAQAMIGTLIQFSVPVLAVSTLAGIAGAVLIAINRSVLTAGVMIVLALVPPPAIAALATAAGDLDIAWRALLRWLLEVGIVAVTGIAVFAWKRAAVQRRRIAD